MLLCELFPEDEIQIEEDLKGLKRSALGALAAGGIAFSGWNASQKAPEPVNGPPQEIQKTVELDVDDSIAEKEKRLLALTIWGEARNQGEKGMRGVAHVIMNRVNANKKMFGGDTIEGVVKHRKQFSAWNENDPNREAMLNVLNLKQNTPDFKSWKKALEIADEVISGKSKDPTHGALFYHTTSVKPNWARGIKPVARLADHVFYTKARQA